MKKYILFTISISFLLSCNQQNDTYKNLPDITLKKVNTFTLEFPDENFLVGNFRTGFQVNSTHTLFAFNDVTLNKIIVTDNNGRVLSEMGSEGRGPEEFEHITSYGFDREDNLVIYDGRLALIKLFSKDGTYLRAFSPNTKNYFLSPANLISYKDHYYTGIIESQYLANPKELTSSAILAKIDTSGETSKIFGSYDSLATNGSQGSFFPAYLAFDESSKTIYEAQTNSYIIQGWNIETAKRTLFIDTKPLNYNNPKEPNPRGLSREEIRERSTGNSFTLAVYKTSEFITLFFNNLPKPSDKAPFYIALYDTFGRYLGDKKLPNKLLNIIDNKLYIVSDENPANYTIETYEIILE
jgi:hypothetical protein